MPTWCHFKGDQMVIVLIKMGTVMISMMVVVAKMIVTEWVVLP